MNRSRPAQVMPRAWVIPPDTGDGILSLFYTVSDFFAPAADKTVDLPAPVSYLQPHGDPGLRPHGGPGLPNKQSVADP